MICGRSRVQTVRDAAVTRATRQPRTQRESDQRRYYEMRHAYVMDGPDGSAAKVTKYTVKSIKLANRNRDANRIATRATGRGSRERGTRTGTAHHSPLSLSAQVPVTTAALSHSTSHSQDATAQLSPRRRTNRDSAVDQSSDPLDARARPPAIAQREALFRLASNPGSDDFAAGGGGRQIGAGAGTHNDCVYRML